MEHKLAAEDKYWLFEEGDDNMIDALKEVAYEDRINSLKKANEHLDGRNKELINKIESLVNEKDELIKHNKSLLNKVELLSCEREELSEYKSTTLIELQNSKSRIKKLSCDNEAYKKDNEWYKRQLEESNKVNKEVHLTNRNLNSKTQEGKEEIDNLIAELKERSNKETRYDRLLEDVEELKQTLKVLAKHI